METVGLSEESRFAFGANWSHFLSVIDNPRIARAQESLKAMLGVDTLEGRRFLDAGAGSGLFSLAARRLGATVVSFDRDLQCVSCATELRQRYFPADIRWQVLQGSVLDEAFLGALGEFDVVYSWGVLHHTGAMWNGLDLLMRRVSSGGKFFIAIYNDQGPASSRWTRMKRLYNGSAMLRPAVLLYTLVRCWTLTFVRDALSGRPFRTWRTYGQERGMSAWHDVVDWAGGYPFEVAKPEAIFRFCRDRGFALTEMSTCGGGIGCNEYVFVKTR